MTDLAPATTTRRIALQDETPAATEQPREATATGRSAWMLRPILLAIHRYVGLFMAVFLFMAGTTGILLAFNHELDAAVSPELLTVSPPFEGAPMKDPLVLRDILEQQVPGMRASYVPLVLEPGHALSLFVEPEAGASSMQASADDEYFLDPYTGEILGSRKWGDITQGTKNLMPFVYRLHYSLGLGPVGTVLFGIVALLWTFDCFIGAYLTFPTAGRRHRRPPGVWLRRWTSSWMLRTGKLFSLVFSWHRASGLWVWAMLLVYAWSSVGFNLREVYDPVMNAALGRHNTYFELASLDEPKPQPELSWQQARSVGEEHMAAQAAAHGLQFLEPRALGHDPAKGVFRYRARSSADISDRYPNTTVWFDADTGELRAFDAPTGQVAGNTVTAWLFNLHMGSVAGWGLPYRVFVSMMGLFVALLSVTGVWIWWRKRRPRGARR